MTKPIGAAVIGCDINPMAARYVPFISVSGDAVVRMAIYNHVGPARAGLAVRFAPGAR